MAESSGRKFDAPAANTDELITFSAWGVLTWRRPLHVGGGAVPFRQTGEPFQGANNDLCR